MVPIDTPEPTGRNARIIDALCGVDSSLRLQAALAAGSDPGLVFLEALVARCAVEPDFFVRDMLSWALTRLPPEAVLPRIRPELGSEHAQARSQALHTLSKIGEPRTWEWITPDHLQDADDEVARTAWRTAVVLVPDAERAGLAHELAGRLGRGDRGLWLSLSRALIDLGEAAVGVLAGAADAPDPDVAVHARATDLLRRDPERGFDEAIEVAKRMLRPGSDAGVDPAPSPATQPGPTSLG